VDHVLSPYLPGCLIWMRLRYEAGSICLMAFPASASGRRRPRGCATAFSLINYRFHWLGAPLPFSAASTQLRTRTTSTYFYVNHLPRS
jgi:hypothetical protein